MELIDNKITNSFIQIKVSPDIEILAKNEFKLYENELMEIFKANYFKNGGMLYSDDFLINSDFIIIAKAGGKVIAYMAVCNFTEKEIDAEYETYQEKLVIKNSLLIKHLAVIKEYRNQKIATQLFEYIKSYAIKNNINYLYLWTTLDNKAALSCYKKQGFHKMGDFYPADGVFQGLNRLSFNYDGS